MKLSIVLWIAAAGIFVCHGMIDKEPMSASDLIQIANEKLNRTTDELAAPPLAVIPGVSHAVISSDRFDSRWPNAVVYYKIASSFTAPKRKTILDSMAAISKVSCIRFLEADPSMAAYVDILRTVNGQDKGCYSFIGKIGRRQDLSLGSNCVHESVVVHELLHALGFYHEQNRRDRDSFVRILTENIAAGAESNFKMVDKHLIDHLGVTYDRKSVMHYGRYTFSRQRGLPTIESLDPDDPSLGGHELSPTDIERLNKYYCADQATTTITTSTTTTTPKTTTTKSTTTTPKTTTTTTTKSVTTTPKTTTTTAESTTTTMESTTTTTPKTTTTTTPETTTTKSTTTSTTSIPGGCSDEILICVLVHKSSVRYRESLCNKALSTYADMCPYACGTCSPSNAQERCKNFKNDDQSTAQALNTRAKIEELVPGTGAASCEDLAKQGRCQSPSIGYNVRILCSRSCCMEGQLYTLRKSSYVM